MRAERYKVPQEEEEEERSLVRDVKEIDWREGEREGKEKGRENKKKDKEITERRAQTISESRTL